MLCCLLDVGDLLAFCVLTALNLSDQSLKVCIYHIWHLHLFVMILAIKGVFTPFQHLNLCQPAVHTIAIFLVVLEQVRS